MKKMTILLTVLLVGAGLQAQTKTDVSKPDPKKKIKTVEASCGQCKFGLKGKGCDLAVRFDGEAFYVDGTSIDEHGDAHATTGFCSAIRKAEVQGKVVDNRFKATYFKLLPDSVTVKPKTNR